MQEACPPGQWSSTGKKPGCKAWKICGDDEEIDKEGTSNADRTCKKKPTYSYVTGNWDNCSEICGGIKRRSVTCKKNGTETVADSYCTGTKPVGLESCNINACNDDLIEFTKDGVLLKQQGSNYSFVQQDNGNLVNSTSGDKFKFEATRDKTVNIKNITKNNYLKYEPSNYSKLKGVSNFARHYFNVEIFKKENDNLYSVTIYQAGNRHKGVTTYHIEKVQNTRPTLFPGDNDYEKAKQGYEFPGYGSFDARIGEGESAIDCARKYPEYEVVGHRWREDENNSWHNTCFGWKTLTDNQRTSYSTWEGKSTDRDHQVVRKKSKQTQQTAAPPSQESDVDFELHARVVINGYLYSTGNDKNWINIKDLYTFKVDDQNLNLNTNVLNWTDYKKNISSIYEDNSKNIILQVDNISYFLYLYHDSQGNPSYYGGSRVSKGEYNVKSNDSNIRVKGNSAATINPDDIKIKGSEGTSNVIVSTGNSWFTLKGLKLFSNMLASSKNNTYVKITEVSIDEQNRIRIKKTGDNTKYFLRKSDGWIKNIYSIFRENWLDRYTPLKVNDENVKVNTAGTSGGSSNNKITTSGMCGKKSPNEPYCPKGAHCSKYWWCGNTPGHKQKSYSGIYKWDGKSHFEYSNAGNPP